MERSGHAQMGDELTLVVEADQEVFAPSTDPGDGGAEGVERRAELATGVGIAAEEGATPQAKIELATDGLDLGEFRHGRHATVAEMTGPSAADERSSYLAEVVVSAGLLGSVDEAAAGEAWASGAVAEWLRLGGRSLADVVSTPNRLAERLIAWVEVGAPPGPEDDDPEWLDDVGTAEPVSALRLRDPDSSLDTALIVEFIAASGARHDLSVTIREGHLVDVTVGPAGLAQAVNDGLDPRFASEPADPDRVMDEMRAAVADFDPAELSGRARLDLPLLCRRLGIDPAGIALAFGDLRGPVADLARDRDDDHYAAELVRSALGRRSAPDSAAPIPTAVEEAAQAFAERVAAADRDARAVLEVSETRIEEVASRPLDGLVRAVGAYLAPADLSIHAPDEREPIADLEPADWVGVLLGVLRPNDAIPLTGEIAVRHINRCPEIATTIPARDAPALAWAFDRVLYAWECTGVLGEDGLVTEAGRWLLPRAADQAWSDAARF